MKNVLIESVKEVVPCVFAFCTISGQIKMEYVSCCIEITILDCMCFIPG